MAIVLADLNDVCTVVIIVKNSVHFQCKIIVEPTLTSKTHAHKHTVPVNV